MKTAGRIMVLFGSMALSLVLSGTGSLGAFVSAPAVADNGALSWSTNPTPAPSPTTNVLNGVSCPSTTLCIAVGYYGKGPVNQTLVEALSGGSWTVVPSPDQGAYDNVLNSVSCVTPTSCVAVGYESTQSGVSKTLVESWDGSAWSIIKSPDVGEHDNSLEGVSCTTASSCDAVGTYTDSHGGTATLAEQWIGTAWSLLPSPDPGGNAGNNSLNGVSCIDAHFCVAVGKYTPRSKEGRTLVEDWDGKTWSYVSSPNPGSGANGLNGTSCTGTAFCMAAGYRSNGSTDKTLVMSWHGIGTKWTLSASPDPSPTNNYLNAISCTDPGFCVAVGYYSAGSVEKTLALTFDGTDWSVTPSGDEGSGDNNTRAVNCPKPRIKEFVGSFLEAPPAHNSGSRNLPEPPANQTLIESFTGTQWVVTTSPNKSDGDNDLNSVSCVTTSFCVAVGTYRKSETGETLTLIESWDGSSWSIVPSPNKGTSGDNLTGVSCVSTQFCIAVGAIGTFESRTLIESWDGSKWSIASSPDNGAANYLWGVNCVSSHFCVAVGVRGYGASTEGTLVESWNGSRWAIISSPNPSESSLEGVSCTSSLSCQAVGFKLKGTLVESWDGSRWSVTPSPDKGPYGGDLSSVSCSTRNSCKAVGSYDYSSAMYAIHTLIESWNGKTWSVEASPNPTIHEDVLQSVSCVSSTDCVAAGSVGPPPGEVGRTVIESWNGSAWGVTPTPNVGNKLNPYANSLFGVSCPASSYCIAVGSYFWAQENRDQTLIETGS
jgi:putative hemolysin